MNEDITNKLAGIKKTNHWRNGIIGVGSLAAIGTLGWIGYEIHDAIESSGNQVAEATSSLETTMGEGFGNIDDRLRSLDERLESISEDCNTCQREGDIITNNSVINNGDSRPDTSEEDTPERRTYQPISHSIFARTCELDEAENIGSVLNFDSSTPAHVTMSDRASSLMQTNLGPGSYTIDGIHRVEITPNGEVNGEEVLDTNQYRRSPIERSILITEENCGENPIQDSEPISEPSESAQPRFNGDEIVASRTEREALSIFDPKSSGNSPGEVNGDIYFVGDDSSRDTIVRRGEWTEDRFIAEELMRYLQTDNNSSISMGNLISAMGLQNHPDYQGIETVLERIRAGEFEFSNSGYTTSEDTERLGDGAAVLGFLYRIAEESQYSGASVNQIIDRMGGLEESIVRDSGFAENLSAGRNAGSGLWNWLVELFTSDEYADSLQDNGSRGYALREELADRLERSDSANDGLKISDPSTYVLQRMNDAYNVANEAIEGGNSR